MLKFFQFAKNGVPSDTPPHVLVVATPINHLDPIKPGNTVITDTGVIKRVEFGTKYNSYVHLKVIQMINVSDKHYGAQKFVPITPEHYYKVITKHVN